MQSCMVTTTATGQCWARRKHWHTSTYWCCRCTRCVRDMCVCAGQLSRAGVGVNRVNRPGRGVVGAVTAITLWNTHLAHIDARPHRVASASSYCCAGGSPVRAVLAPVRQAETTSAGANGFPRACTAAVQSVRAPAMGSASSQDAPRARNPRAEYAPSRSAPSQTQSHESACNRHSWSTPVDLPPPLPLPPPDGSGGQLYSTGHIDSTAAAANPYRHGARRSSRLRLPQPTPPPAPIAGCECNPETALKVQYLRLIHNFCDNPTSFNHKRLLLSDTERDELQALAGETCPSLRPFALVSFAG